MTKEQKTAPVSMSPAGINAMLRELERSSDSHRTRCGQLANALADMEVRAITAEEALKAALAEGESLRNQLAALKPAESPEA